MPPFQGGDLGSIPNESKGRVAQWIERLTSNQEVVGSIPTAIMCVAQFLVFLLKKDPGGCELTPRPYTKAERHTGHWSSGMISRLGREGSRFDSAVAPQLTSTTVEMPKINFNSNTRGNTLLHPNNVLEAAQKIIALNDNKAVKLTKFLPGMSVTAVLHDGDRVVRGKVKDVDVDMIRIETDGLTETIMKHEIKTLLGKPVKGGRRTRRSQRKRSHRSRRH